MTQPLVVITGASSGIGLGAARAFMAAGYPLLLISRHIEPIAGFADKPVLYGQVDVADYNALQHAIFETELRFGGTDCLINSAGLADQDPLSRLTQQATTARLTPTCVA
jgi:NADP-dependent 3-hydroxy acid dehydrogenase YdfG